jgi:hypothetical protein
MQAETIGVGSQVKMLVFDGSPKPFDENVVQGTALGIHANFYCVGKQRFGEIMTGELTTLIGIEDFGFSPLG